MINIGLTDKARVSIVKMLNTLLADEFILYAKTRRFHWNVVGQNFSEYHKFFEAQYEAIDEILDQVAERARALDGVAAGSLKEFNAMARLDEQAGRNPEAKGMIRALLADHETVIRQLRKDVEASDTLKDAATSDFFTGLMAQHEKMAWMLRAYIN